MKKILLSFILAGIGFSTALAQQTVPGIKATFDGKTVYYKTGEAPVLSYKVDEQAKTKNALIRLKGITEPVLNVTLTQEKNLEIERADYVEPKVKVEGVSDTVGFNEKIFPDLKIAYGEEGEILVDENYYVLYKAIVEGEVEKDDYCTPTDAGKYNMYVTFKYPYYGTVKQTFAIVNHQQVLKDLIKDEGEAAECLKKTKGQVPDEVHNALDAALENEIEKAKEVAGTDGQSDAYYKEEVKKLQEAMENSYRQYWFDNLSQLIMTVDVYQKGLRDDPTTKEKLAAALKEANGECQGVIDLEKSSKTYKDAYDKLWDEYQDAIGPEVIAQITALYESIDAYKNENDLAYDDSKALLGDAIKDAEKTYEVYKNKEGYVHSDIATLTKAIATLKEKAEKITKEDYEKALSELNPVITEAQSEYTTIYAINTTIATTLKEEIQKAESFVESGVARDVVAEVEVLNNAIAIAKDAVNSFKENSSELEETILAAQTQSENIDQEHTGIKQALTDAIGEANTVLENNKTKTNEDLKGAIKKLADAIEESKKAETAAKELKAKIQSAENDVLGTIVDTDKRAELQGAIEAAESLFTDKSKTSSDYEEAVETLSNTIISVVESDILLARNALDDAIEAAKSKIDEVVLSESKANIGTAVNAAVEVSKNTEAKAQELYDAKSVLSKAVEDIVAEDLAYAKKELSNAIDLAKSAMKPYLDIAESIISGGDNYREKVIEPFQEAIGEAETVMNSEISTSNEVISKINDLSKAQQAMEDAYANQMTIETQKLAVVYSKEKYFAETVKNDNDVIGKKFEDAENHAAEVYGSITADPETQYTLADVINARTGMDDEYQALQAEYEQWKSNLDDLNTWIGKANELYTEIQDALKETVGSELQLAISIAGTVVDKKRETYSSDLEKAKEALQKAIDTAEYENTHWDFTDANPTFKLGQYDAGCAKYTRTGDAITAGNYATFCMPMDIKVTYEGEDALFSSVYLPAEFAILNSGTNILKLFLTKVDEATVIPAGTPFFAQLACAGSLVLKNDNALTVVEDPTSVADLTDVVYPTSVAKHPTTIKIYDQTDNSSFVTLDNDITFVWNGTFQKTTDTTDKFVFKPNGSFGKASASISPFRAYLEQKSKTQNVKNIMDIEVEFGDGGEVTGIEGIMAGASDDTQIYSIDGKKMGNDMKSLNKGVYIINGKKVLK